MALPDPSHATAPARTTGATWAPEGVVTHPAVADLLRPLDPRDFFAHWWEHAPVHVSLQGGRRGALIHVEDLDGLLAVCSPGQGEFHVQVASAGRDGLAVIEEAPADPAGRYDVEALRQRLELGRAVVARRIDLRWRPITRMCRGLESALRCPVQADLHHVPAGGAGLGPRSEEHDVFVIQAQGRRTWALHEPSKAPARPSDTERSLQEISRARMRAPEPFAVVTLSEGDLLYVPRGWTSQPAPPAGESSLHVAVGVHPLRWSDLLTRLLQAAAEADPRLDRAIPLGDTDAPDVAQALLATLPNLASGLLGQGLHRSVVEALAPEFLAEMEPPPEGRADTAVDLDAIDADTPVIRRLALPCSVREDGMVATIHFPGGEASFPRRLRPALEFIASAGRFTARNMPPQIAQEAALFLVRRLCREGLLFLA